MSHYNLPHDHGQAMDKVLDQMPSFQHFQDLASLFQQLSDPTRLKIVWLLCHSEACVCNLAGALQVSPPAISHHLKGLRQKKLIISRRRGKEVFYTLADTPETRLLHQAMDALFQISCPGHLPVPQENS